MSENNYGALMLKSALDTSVDVTKIIAPGIYPVIAGNASVPDSSAGLMMVVLTATSQKTTFQKESSSVVYSLINGKWKKPEPGDVGNFGTAAFCDVTTSKIDNTSGRALKVGDFGLGSQTYGVIPDSRQVSERAAYGVSFSRVYKSPDAPRMDTYYNLLMLPDTLNGAFSALAMSNNETPLYRAYGVGSGNSTNWVKLYDEKNKPTPADIGALPTSGGKVTGPLEIESTSPTLQLTETDTSKKYFIVVDNGNIRLNQDTLAGVNGILSFDATTKDWTLPGRVIPKNYDNFNSLFQKINTSSLGTNGWFKDTNTGLIIQYGIAGGEGAAKNYPIQFPIAFPSRCLSIQVTLQSASWDPSSGSAMGQIINNTQAYCWSTHSFFWFAIGL
ncbi:gp53-like domain-containing protein [Citrobacter freundii]|uniref:gp53-like domain-containing protein n=1 Tax=Citrobacter freundii TaxID=546 RepID=UPI00300C1F79